MQLVLQTVEDASARLGYYAFVVGLAASLGVLAPRVPVPSSLAVLAFVSCLSLFGLSFGTFLWQTRSERSKARIAWGIVLLPFVLYVPLNLALLAAGLVDLQLNDYGAFYNAAVRWLEGAPLYETTRDVPGMEAALSEDMPYLYPPVFVLLFVPFTLLPPVAAGVAWNLLTLAFLVWAVSKLVATFDVSLDGRRRLLLYFLVVSFGPTVTWLKLGQISGLMAGLLCLAGAALRAERDELSGVATTLGSLVKPFYATSGAHLLRDRRRFLAAAGSGVALLAVGVAVFGVEAHLAYLDVLRAGKGWETGVGPARWHATHFNPFYVLGPLKHLPRVLLVVGTAGLALHSNRTGAPVEYVFALGVAVVPLAGPTANTLALNAAIPAILMAGLYELERTGEFPRALAASALLVHVHPYTVELLSKLGPRTFAPLELLTPVVPLLQPALYGTVLLVGYLVVRSVEE